MVAAAVCAMCSTPACKSCHVSTQLCHVSMQLCRASTPVCHYVPLLRGDPSQREAHSTAEVLAPAMLGPDPGTGPGTGRGHDAACPQAGSSSAGAACSAAQGCQAAAQQPCMLCGRHVSWHAWLHACDQRTCMRHGMHVNSSTCMRHDMHVTSSTGCDADGWMWGWCSALLQKPPMPSSKGI